MRSLLQVEWLEGRDLPSVITGEVFQDFNANGKFDTTATIPNASTGTIGVAVDLGVANVQVTAFDSTNTVAGTATTNAGGAYTLNTVGTGPYRIQFGNLPAGYFPGPQGPDSGTTVQFDNAAGGSGTFSLGLVRPDQYSPDNPTLVTSSYVFGAFNGPNGDLPVIVSFQYSAGTQSSDGTLGDYTNPTTHALAVTQNQVGTTWGLAYNPFTQTIFAAAYMKKLTGFGPSGTGAIYQMGTTGTTATTFADLNAIFGAGTAGADLHDFTTTDDNGNITWDAVGKNSLGGLAISGDGSRIYVMNLADRSLYALPTSGPLNTTTVYRQQLPTPLASMGVTGITAGNPLGDLRPFAVQVYQGKIYVGAVNSAEATQNSSDLHAYVFQVTDNGTSLVFNPTPVLQLNLNFARGQTNPGQSGNWLPWVTTKQTIPGGNQIYPQPMLTGLAFDASGNMVLGFRDRDGDQSGAGGTAGRGITAGDTLRASGNTTSGWTLENNGSDGTNTTGGAGNGEGPGGGEFYYQDTYDFTGSTHHEVSLGGVLQLPGFPNVLSSTFDPAYGVRAGGGFNAGGVSWFNDTTGQTNKAYQLYQNGNPNFSKADGIGDVVAAINPAPLEIGNLVWNDRNGDGIQEAGEPGIAGVTVDLYDPNGNLLATAVTDANGNYYFSNNAGTSTGSVIFNVSGLKANTNGYTLRLDKASDYAAGGPLAGLMVTQALAGSDPSIDSNGVLVGGFARTTVNTAGPGANNHTFDFGFATPLTIGDFVFNDANNDGILDNGETGIANVPVALLDSNGNVVASTTTDGTGHYQFTNLLPGTYSVRITPPAGFVSSTGTNGSASGPFEPGVSGTQDNQDHGTTSGAFIVTAPITLGAAGSAQNPDNGGTANLRQDFGLFQTLSIGNFVWNDANNDGLVGNGETGLSGVTVNLRDQNGNLVATTTTNAQGGYLFTDLTPGQYRVEVVTPFGFTSSTGIVDAASGPFEPAPNNNLDNQDKGTTNGAVVQGGLINLQLGTQPTGETPTPGGVVDPALDANSNLTQDFGFFQPLTLGDFVFNDANNNGILDNGEQGVANVLVVLLDGNGNPLLDGNGNPITTLTDSNGIYQFTNLIPGTYIVQITPPAGFVTSTGTNGSATGPFEPGLSDTTDNADHGTAVAGGVIQTASVTLGPAGSAQNPDFDSNEIAGTANLRQDFGLFQTLSIGNFVWNDVNNDGLVDNGETGIAGATVNLRDPNGNLVATTTTNAQGGYLFTDLTPGQYQVEVITPSGFTSSTGTSGSASGPFEPAPNNNLDNEDKGTTNGTVVQGGLIDLQLGSQLTGETPTPGITDPALDANSNLTQDFGFFQSGSLSGFVYVDMNGNGVKDNGDTPLSGVTVTLEDANGNTLATTTTGRDGSYLFTGVGAGTYSVVEGPTPTFAEGTNTVGAVAGTPVGTLGPATDQISAITLGAGQSGINYNFGEVGASVSGTVFLDQNNDGKQEPGENGIPNVTITLTGTNGDVPVTLTTTTASDGTYSFNGLGPGTYQISEGATPGFQEGTNAVGTVNGTPNGQLGPGTDVISGIVLRAGDKGITYTFAEIGAADVGVTKTVDHSAPNVGDLINFTVTAINNGPNTATGVTITDPLPSGLSFVSATPSQGTYDSGTGLWSVGTLTNGGQATLTIQARVTSPAAQTNTATVSHLDQVDRNPSNDTASATETPQQADVVLSKVVNPASVIFHFNVTYTLIVRNNGPDTAANVTVADPLAPGLIFVSANTPSQGTFDPATNVWTVGSLANGATATLSIVAQVNGLGPIVNNAFASTSTFDPNLANGRASAPLQAVLSKRSFLASTMSSSTNTTTTNAATTPAAAASVSPNAAANLLTTNSVSNTAAVTPSASLSSTSPSVSTNTNSPTATPRTNNSVTSGGGANGTLQNDPVPNDQTVIQEDEEDDSAPAEGEDFSGASEQFFAAGYGDQEERSPGVWTLSADNQMAESFAGGIRPDTFREKTDTISPLMLALLATGAVRPLPGCKDRKRSLLETATP
jgi:uncharacterized repeat protein (TIGR01451 family)